MASRARIMAGTSVSIVVFELGTIWPMRKFILDMEYSFEQWSRSLRVESIETRGG